MPLIELVVLSNYIGQEGAPTKGQIVRVDDKRARYLIEHSLARLRHAPGPQADKMKGAHEEKKSSGEALTGRSIVSPSSSASGQGEPSSVLQAAPASRSRRSRRAANTASLPLQ